MQGGALTIGNFKLDVVWIGCRKCDRADQYRRSTLIERFGADHKLPDLRNDLAAGCPRLGKMTDGCGAYFMDLAG